jgi:guanylate kinase
LPELDAESDIVLEIELNGARQVKGAHPEALVVFVRPPSREEQQRRLQGRGDPDEHVVERLRKADEEEREGAVLADFVVVNDDFERAIAEIQAFIGAARDSRR